MRKNDPANQSYDRTAERIYSQDNEWFLRTREGIRGPFRNRREAEAELALYADTMRFLDDNRRAMPGDLDLNDITVVNFDRPAWN